MRTLNDGNTDRTESVVVLNGVPVDELTDGAVGGVNRDGGLLEREHHGLVLLADGSATNDLRATGRCDLCAAEVQILALNGRIAPVQAMLLSRYPVTDIVRSAMSGMQLCPMHRRQVSTDDGTSLVVAPHEATQIEQQRRWRRRIRMLLGLFVALPRA